MSFSSSSSSSSTSSPCAACKCLRRKCTQECVFAPYFPPDNPQKFANVHKVFGASNVAKILNDLTPAHREDAVNSLAYEAEYRLRDPVYGCVGLISVLQHKLKQVQHDLHAARNELARYTALSPPPAAAAAAAFQMMPMTQQQQWVPQQQFFEAQQLAMLRSYEQQQQQQNNLGKFESGGGTSYEAAIPYVAEHAHQNQHQHQLQLQAQATELLLLQQQQSLAAAVAAREQPQMAQAPVTVRDKSEEDRS